MPANLPELLPTCFVKCCLTLQESLGKKKKLFTARCPNLKLLDLSFLQLNQTTNIFF
jgi:hypothetical protein